MTPDERKAQGPAINGLKDRITQAIAERKDSLGSAALDSKLASESIDVTLPVRETPAETGRVHPISQVTDEVHAMGRFAKKHGDSLYMCYVEVHDWPNVRGVKPSLPKNPALSIAQSALIR